MLGSFDVGTKHLAFCVLDGTDIKLWTVLDLSGSTIRFCTKDGCKFSAKFLQNNTAYCKRCAKTLPEFHSLQHVTHGGIRSLKIAQLRELLTDHDETPPRSKAECIEASQRLIKLRKPLPIAETKSKTTPLPEIGIRLMQKLDACLDEAGISPDVITKIAIENQVGPIASTMKAVQGMITQYWIMRGVTDIIYVSAANKLKPFTKEKLTYKQRKKLAVEKTSELIAKDAVHYVTFFATSKKKDDLADAYLQGLWVVSSAA